MPFRRTCPECKAHNKVVKRCNKCLNFVCSNCSIWGYCVDCYVDLKAKEESRLYHNEKVLSLT